MATEVLMPQMGESIAEGTITRWLFQVGDTVERDEPLLEISTDKVDAEIPSPASGVLIEIRRQENETVPVNEVVGLIGEAGERPATSVAATGDDTTGTRKLSEEEIRALQAGGYPMSPEPEPETRPEDQSPPADEAEARPEDQSPPADEAGGGPAGGATAGGATAEGGPAEGAAAGDAAAGDAAAGDAAAGEATGTAGDGDGEMTLEQRIRRFSSPLVRSIAKREGVDLAKLTGTGVHGRVTKKDIMAYLERRASGEETPAAAPGAPPATAPTAAPPAPPAAAPGAPKPAAGAPQPAARPAGTFSVAAYGPGENVTVEPMSRIRQITAAHMTYSKATSAHVTTVFHVDMTRVARLRQRAKDRFQREVRTKLTYMPFIFKAVARALRKYPQLNAAIDGTNVVYKNDVNLGMAVAMDHGLIVPVIKNADSLNLVGLARAANDLADRARTKKLNPEEATGGTFTITNPGVFGSLFGTPVINQPQVAILGIGTIEKRPIVLTDDHGADMIAIRTMSYFALTFDHRLIDGADADAFMNAVKDTLQDDEWGELEPYL